jgi:hypothetical protein
MLRNSCDTESIVAGASVIESEGASLGSQAQPRPCLVLCAGGVSMLCFCGLLERSPGRVAVLVEHGPMKAARFRATTPANQILHGNAFSPLSKACQEFATVLTLSPTPSSPSPTRVLSLSRSHFADHPARSIARMLLRGKWQLRGWPLLISFFPSQWQYMFEHGM